MVNLLNWYLTRSVLARDIPRPSDQETREINRYAMISAVLPGTSGVVVPFVARQRLAPSDRRVSFPAAGGRLESVSETVSETAGQITTVVKAADELALALIALGRSIQTFRTELNDSSLRPNTPVSETLEGTANRVTSAVVPALQAAQQALSTWEQSLRDNASRKELEEQSDDAQASGRSVTGQGDAPAKAADKKT
jgi:hypothetical protein